MKEITANGIKTIANIDAEVTEDGDAVVIIIKIPLLEDMIINHITGIAMKIM